MLSALHRFCAMLSLLLVGSFWTSTVVAELWLEESFIVRVKTVIPYGFILLLPAIAITGATGMVLSRGRMVGRAKTKRNRMPFIALNGLVILIPSALFLSMKAQAGEFDRLFFGVQAVELLAGAINLYLLGRNALDGRRLARRSR